MGAVSLYLQPESWNSKRKSSLLLLANVAAGLLSCRHCCKRGFEQGEKLWAEGWASGLRGSAGVCKMWPWYSSEMNK